MQLFKSLALVFDMISRIDEKMNDRWSLQRVALDALAASMLVTIILDLWRLFLGPIVPIPESQQCMESGLVWFKKPSRSQFHLKWRHVKCQASRLMLFILILFVLVCCKVNLNFISICTLIMQTLQRVTVAHRFEVYLHLYLYYVRLFWISPPSTHLYLEIPPHIFLFRNYPL